MIWCRGGKALLCMMRREQGNWARVAKRGAYGDMPAMKFDEIMTWQPENGNEPVGVFQTGSAIGSREILMAFAKSSS